RRAATSLASGRSASRITRSRRHSRSSHCRSRSRSRVRWRRGDYGGIMTNKVRVLSLSRYVEAALRLAEYERDEEGIVIAQVPMASGFYAQGETFEDARENLRDVLEANVLLALQLGLPIRATH